MKKRAAPKPPAKSALTRERIFSAALHLFAARGYASTSMRDIAARAGCAVGLLYRYFPRRESFVLELYRRQAAAAELQATKLRARTVGARFAEATHARVASMRPHRAAFRALAGAGLDPKSGVAVFGHATKDIRDSAERTLRIVIAGATDRPPPPLAEALVRPLFVMQLVAAVALTQDDTRNATKVRKLIDAMEEALTRFLPFLPLASPTLLELDALIATFTVSR